MCAPGGMGSLGEGIPLREQRKKRHFLRDLAGCPALSTSVGSWEFHPGGRRGSARGRRRTRRPALAEAPASGHRVGDHVLGGDQRGPGSNWGATPGGGRGGSASPACLLPRPCRPPPTLPPRGSRGSRAHPASLLCGRPEDPESWTPGVASVRGRVLGAGRTPQSGFAERPPRGRARDPWVCGLREAGLALRRRRAHGSREHLREDKGPR